MYFSYYSCKVMYFRIWCIRIQVKLNALNRGLGTGLHSFKQVEVRRIQYFITENLWNEIFDLHKGAKRPQCYFHFIIKLGVRYNIALQLKSLCNIFYIVNISFFRIVWQKLKIGLRKYGNIFHIEWKKYSFLFHIYLITFFITLCRDKFEICCLIHLVKRGLHFQFQELRLRQFSTRSYSDFIHKIGITL